MKRSLLALPFVPFVLVPVATAAQDGPSFNCADSDTRTEFAICASPELSRLDWLMIQAYEGLVDTIGQREARAIADEFLARRQACEGDTDCIADRLLITMEAFNQRAGRTTDLAEVEAILRGVPARSELALAEPPVVIEEPTPAPPVLAAAPEPAPAPPVVAPEPAAPEPEVATAAPPAAAPDVPLAAQAPWPIPDLPTSEEFSDALDGAELASSDGAAAEPDLAAAEPAPDLTLDPALAPAAADPSAPAAFDTPLSWAFMDLSREERAALQERLVQAGLFDGAATGSWTNATLSALEAAAEGSEGFDLTTQPGAALLFDYVGSDAFASTAGIEPASAGVSEPLAGTDW